MYATAGVILPVSELDMNVVCSLPQWRQRMRCVQKYAKWTVREHMHARIRVAL